MSTQLRLVETPARSGARAARRAVRWPDWRLDPRARNVGRRGVAQARAALAQADPPDPPDPPAGPETRLSKAS